MRWLIRPARSDPHAAQVEQTALPGLAACPALEAVALGVEIYLDRAVHALNALYWHRTLALLAATPPGVRCVRVAVRTWADTGTSDFAPLAALEWALLDAHAARYARLDELQILVSSRTVAPWDTGVEAMRAEIEGRFSGQNRTLVQVAFDEPDAWDA